MTSNDNRYKIDYWQTIIDFREKTTLTSLINTIKVNKFVNQKVHYPQTKPQILYSIGQNPLWKVSITVTHLICTNNMIDSSKINTSPSYVEYLTILVA